MTFFDGRRDRLDAFRRGERAVLTEVFHAYVDRISTLVRHGFRLPTQGIVIAGASDIERERDLVQEVFARAFSERARLGFNALLPYGPYLLQIARNLMVDEARKGGTLANRTVSDVELEAAESLELSADEQLEQERLKAVTAEYCAGLPSEVREFVRLRYEAGLSQRDVATQLGVSRRRVRTWEEMVHEGLRALLKTRGLTGD